MILQPVANSWPRCLPPEARERERPQSGFSGLGSKTTDKPAQSLLTFWGGAAFPRDARGGSLTFAVRNFTALPAPREPEIASDKRDSGKADAGDRSGRPEALFGTAGTPSEAGRRSTIIWFRGQSRGRRDNTAARHRILLEALRTRLRGRQGHAGRALCRGDRGRSAAHELRRGACLGRGKPRELTG